MTQREILSIIKKNERPITTSEITMILEITPSSVNRCLRKLEEFGFIKSVKKKEGGIWKKKYYF